MAIITTPQTYNKGELTQLLDIARNAIQDHFSDRPINAPRLNHYTRKMQQHAACFVTLEVNNVLQGSMGTTIATRPLVIEVHNKAVASAYEDRRFMPLSEEQLDELTIEVEVLSSLETLAIHSHQALVEHLQIPNNRQGIVLIDRYTQTVMLPSAWKKGITPDHFVQQLKQKAGWSPTYWSPNMIVKTFTTSALKEKYAKICSKYF
ncbi:AmmeMemoRadiSam system protein A [Photobacterium angustum]|uniref:AmmeMemoRadiSam system protein A n=1 Tax=Photobacterium angustum TaxID=661 RepID=UPI0005E1EAA7|nr:AmmeMemoRadiSam system protein A [Photobacterium angustum]KJG02734.1 ACR protein [Photobacterium angustum]PSV68591.1 AmmeMemoRadiSam system protein A [Photobacterium angustum]